MRGKELFAQEQRIEIKNLPTEEWEHINFLGEYHFNGIASNTLDKLRPLKIESD